MLCVKVGVSVRCRCCVVYLSEVSWSIAVLSRIPGNICLFTKLNKFKNILCYKSFITHICYNKSKIQYTFDSAPELYHHFPFNTVDNLQISCSYTNVYTPN